MNDFLFNILAWIRSWVGSWGWAMVVFTVMIRLVLTPLDIKSRVSMRKTTKLQPQMQALQKKYANDKEKLNQKMAELYKKEHVNPLSSCLPLLLTWPILIAVFGAMRMAANGQLLQQVTEILRGQSPTMEPWLWIKNLWMPDSLFSPAYPDLGTLRQVAADQWQSWFTTLQAEGIPAALQSANLTAESFTQANLTATIQVIEDALKAASPEYANAVAIMPGWNFNLLITQLSVPNVFNGLMLLPILSAVTQIIMTKITGTGQPQDAGNAQAASTGKFMQWFFPIFSLVICFGYSSAFALYWVAGNLVSMAQTVIINKVLDNKEKNEAALAGEGTVK